MAPRPDKLHGTRSTAGASAVEAGLDVTLCQRTGVRYVQHVAVPLRTATATAHRLGMELCAACVASGEWRG